jgi:spoIIIJ-associated protein
MVKDASIVTAIRFDFKFNDFFLHPICTLRSNRFQALTRSQELKGKSLLMDKLAAANKINEFLQSVVTDGGLHLKYRIVVDPPPKSEWEKPEIFVDFSGPDSALLLDRGGELLRALELLALEILHLPSGEHEKISFDCRNQRSMRFEELRMAASVAAEKVRQTGTPYHFAPMSSRERRMVHLALRDQTDLRTESDGEGFNRCVVLYPADYRPAAGKPARRTLP